MFEDLLRKQNIHILSGIGSGIYVGARHTIGFDVYRFHSHSPSLPKVLVSHSL